MSQLFDLGVAYYPDYLVEGRDARRPDGAIAKVDITEHMRLDFERMQRCGINVARIGEFSWSHVEPRPGQYEFDRFLRALDLAAAQKIKIVLCTPTATPPKWLVDRWPEVLAVTRQGQRIPHGGRRHYDPCSEVYQRESRRITERYAAALGSHPAVIGWQTDNEIGNHGSWQSFTEAARQKFRHWLRQRYAGDIESLNSSWFNHFWSMRLTDFEQVELPLATWTAPNPALELEFRRFMTEENTEFQRQQIAIIRRHSPGRWITHNITPMLFDICWWHFCADLDVAGYDHYQMGSEPDLVSTASQFNLMRSLKNGHKFIVLEQQPVQVNWQPVNRRFPIDWLFLWGAQAAFLGASGMYYFSWQRFTGGSEQFHDAVVPHDLRIPRSRQEKILGAKRAFFQRLATDFQLTELPQPTAEVLVVNNIESHWVHANPCQSVAWDGVKQTEQLQRAFLARGMAVDMTASIAAAQSRLGRYKILVLPGYAFALTEAERRLLTDYMAAGGKVLSLARTGFKDQCNGMVPFPLELYERDDFYFDDYGALLPGEVETVLPSGMPGLKAFTAELWAERVIINNPRNWATIATFGPSGLYAGAPAAIRHVHGTQGGMHLHLAFWPRLDSDFIAFLHAALNTKTYVSLPDDGTVQVVPLGHGGRQFIGAVNFTSQPMPLPLCTDASHYRVLTANIDDGTRLIVSGPAPTSNAAMSIPARGVLFAEVVQAY